MISLLCVYLLLENEYAYDYSEGDEVCRHPRQAVHIWSLETHTHDRSEFCLEVIYSRIHHRVALYAKEYS